MKNVAKPETEDQEVLSISTVTVDIPMTIVPSAVGGKHYTLNVGLIPRTEQARILGHLIARGLKLSLDNVYGHDKTQSLVEKAKEAADRLAEIQDGSFRPNERGGGSRLSPQQRGWVVWLKEIGHQEDSKDVNSKTLDRAQKTLCRRDILAKAGPVGSAERKEVEENIQKHLADRFDAWKAWKETATKGLQEAIAEEVRKDERKAKKAQEPVVDLSSAAF